MKIHYLGTCSGTEPQKGRHHCSLIMECGEYYYWFDAGENCAYAAHTNPALDPRKTKAIFISHPHVDHIGGLANLLFALNKNGYMYHKPLTNGDTRLDIFFPDLKILEMIKTIAAVPMKLPYALKLVEHSLSDGEIYRDENVTVCAVHNRHISEDSENNWHSYSFSVVFEGKKVVYSGDVHTPSELDSLIGDGCDVLIMETGHHRVADVCQYAADRKVKALRLNHHGREILNHLEDWEAYVADFSKQHNMSIIICYDGMSETL